MNGISPPEIVVEFPMVPEEPEPECIPLPPGGMRFLQGAMSGNETLAGNETNVTMTMMGNETMAGNGTVTGNVTMTGNETMAGNATIPPTLPYCIPKNDTIPTNGTSTIPGNGTTPLPTNGTTPLPPNSTTPLNPNATIPVNPNSTVPIAPNTTDPVVNGTVTVNGTSVNGTEPSPNIIASPTAPGDGDANATLVNATA
jgi:hypothetical protein